MITTPDFVSIIVRRDAIKNPRLLERKIRYGLLEPERYDDQLVCFIAGMEAEDIDSSIKEVEKGYGVHLYDKNIPGNRVSKDGVIVAEPFGPRGICNWLKKEGPHQYSCIPENEREAVPTDLESFKEYLRKR